MRILSQVFSSLCSRRIYIILGISVSLFMTYGMAWDADITLDNDGTTTLGAINEFTVTIVNDNVGGSWDDTNTQVLVTLPLGLVFFAEGSYDPIGGATLVSTGGGVLEWNVPYFYSLDTIHIGYQVEMIATGTQLTTGQVIPSAGAPAETTTANNTYFNNIIVSETPTDAVCGTDNGQVYYSGHIFSDLCGTGVASPSVPNFTDTTGWDWQCLSDNGGQDIDCLARVRYCGDMVNDPEEQCDDGANGDDTDGCTDSCTLTYCGDALLQDPNGAGTGGTTNNGDEECDDGANGDDTDGCTDSCTLTYCGDALLQDPNGAGTGGTTNNGDEECDDGNLVDDDGCNTLCQTTFNGVCGSDNGSSFYSISPDGSALTSGSANLCSGTVATGFVYSGTINTWSWICLGSTNGGSDTNCSATESYCGDGNSDVGDGEQCDDSANGDATDGCNDSCEVTTNGDCGIAILSNVYDFEGDGTALTSGSSDLCSGSTVTGFVYSGGAHNWSWTCLGSANGGSDAFCQTNEDRCGDIVENGTEVCDDGMNGDSTDGCNDSCEMTYNGVCGPNDGASLYNVSGDGSVLTGGSADLCSGSLVTGFVYSGGGHSWGWTCLGSVNGGSDITCSATERYCGDNTVDGVDAEGCDYGDTTNNDGCSSTCQREVPSCTVALAPGTGLAPLSVVATPLFDTWAILQSMDWLDGTVNTSTGHTYVTTGSFLATLTVANQYNGSITNTCHDLVQVNTECGNALVEVGEQCDDGINNGVLCNPAYDSSCTYCTLTCTIQTIQGSFCGDGIPDMGEGEQCDDGNTNNNDTCPNDCQLAVCGDGIKEGIEVCDDGNLIDDDECDNTCLLTTPPHYFGSSTSSSSSFHATTQSVDTNTGDVNTTETEKMIDKKKNKYTDMYMRLKRIQMLWDNRQKQKKDNTKKSLDIKSYLQQRNLGIREIIRRRNLFVQTLRSLRDYLRKRNTDIRESTLLQKLPVVPMEQRTTSLSPSIIAVPKRQNIDKKASIMAALKKYIND